MIHQELQDLCGSYALGALEGEELQTLRTHLPECWECRQRVQEFDEIYAEGALVLLPMEPSPAVKSRLMERVSGEARILPKEEGKPPQAVGSGEPSPASPSNPPLRGTSWGLALAMLILGLALGFAACLVLR